MSQERGLRLLVFAAGAVLMGLEIAGSRVLAPHFGNSVYVWGSLISVFLAALAIGYYAGGWLVDRKPSPRLLAGVCLGASAWIIALANLSYRVCAGLADSGIGSDLGPLVTSTLLFLPPSVALGMVSPFAIRIAATSIGTVGSLSGTLYAISTLGSIVGTFITTFVFVPAIGVAAILRTLAVAMLLISLVALPVPKRTKSVAQVGLALLLMGASLMIPASAQTIRLNAHERILHDESTPYHHITVVQNKLTRTRELRFDKDSESAIHLDAPYRTSEVYPDYFHLAFLARPKMERVMFIGAGGGIGPRAFLAHDSDLKIDVVDVDGRVFAMAKEYFFLPESPSIRLIGRDGRMFLRQANEEYDCIVLDAFTAGGRIPFHLVTRECLELARDRLTSHGVFVMNFGSAIEGERSVILRSMLLTAGEVFPNIYLFARNYREIGITNTTNIILVATKDSASISDGEWQLRAAAYLPNDHVGRAQMDRMVADKITLKSLEASAPVFTDDFAAIEMMAY